MKINQRLFDHYGIDTSKDLAIAKRCSKPWDTILIDKQGSCYACECQSWLPQSIGNLQIKSLSEILESPVRQHLQRSIEHGNYRYCNEHQCSYIRSNIIHTSTDEHIRFLRLAIDDSCNLSCPSCRRDMIFHKQGRKFDTRIALADKINEWLYSHTHPVQVHIGSDGDPFASHVYRHFMKHTPNRDHIKYSILTNGLLFKDFHHRIPHVIRNLEKLAISIDGARQTTYETLRRGASWHKLIEGLDSIKSIRRDNGFALEWHMVVQKDNWREMSAMAGMATKYGVDKLFLNKIEDWNTGLDHADQDFWSRPDFHLELDKAKSYPIVRTWNLS